MCRACGQPTAASLCGPCHDSLGRGGERRLDCGLLVASALAHGGAARSLVHHLKYRGLASAAEVLSAAMVQVVPVGAACLIPVPRVLMRMWRYGIDPAGALSEALSRRTGLPVARLLARPLWWAGRAGPAGAMRGSPAFRALRTAPEGAVLVDDVLTTVRRGASVLTIPIAEVMELARVF
ncbi:MAG: hypothetical protein KJ698_12210 [Actinobacteria bacterium]|nr:hypothetical protein [Actinomycetota bacterium]